MKRNFIRLLLVPVLISLFYACGNRNSQKYEGMPQELMELSKQIDKNPKDDKLYYQRAAYYYENSKIEEAIADILVSLRLNPENSTYYVLLSDLYFAQKETDLTEESLEKAIALDPQNNEARLKLAELYFHLKMLEECHQVLDKAVELQPHNPKAHLIRAFSLKDQRDTLGYLRMLQLTVDQDPREVKAFLELGYFYQQSLNPLAINYYTNALLVDPQNIEINYNLAKLYQDLGDFEKANEQYKILLQIRPNNKYALNNLGYIKLVHEDQYEEAVSYFTRAIEQDSLFVNAICNRGIAFVLLEDYDHARQDFLHCRTIDPLFEPAIDELNKLDNLK